MTVSVIAFSGTGEDYVVVKGSPAEVNEALSVGNRNPSGLCQLEELRPRVEGEPLVFVNPDQVAYVRAANG